MVPHHNLHCLAKSDKLLQPLTRLHKQLQTETGVLISELYRGPDSPWNWTKMCLLRLKNRGNDILRPHRTLEGSWWLLHCPRTFDQNMELSKCSQFKCYRRLNLRTFFPLSRISQNSGQRAGKTEIEPPLWISIPTSFRMLN